MGEHDALPYSFLSQYFYTDISVYFSTGEISDQRSDTKNSKACRSRCAV